MVVAVKVNLHRCHQHFSLIYFLENNYNMDILICIYMIIAINQIKKLISNDIDFDFIYF